jgi:hypothetical protein
MDSTGPPTKARAVAGATGRFSAFMGLRLLIWILALAAGGIAVLTLSYVGHLLGSAQIGMGVGVVAWLGIMIYAIYLMDHRDWGPSRFSRREH